MVELSEVEKIAGTEFPGGTYTIEPWEHRLVCDAVLADEPPNGIAHPIYAYHGSRAGMGLTLDELFALCLADPADGGMFGEHREEIRRPLRVGSTYAVTGRIVGVQRKQGRTAGTFDMIEFELELRDDAGVVATSTNKWMFPRKA
jgi:hypothetical protein